MDQPLTERHPTRMYRIFNYEVTPQEGSVVVNGKVISLQNLEGITREQLIEGFKRFSRGDSLGKVVTDLQIPDGMALVKYLQEARVISQPNYALHRPRRHSSSQ